MRQFPFPSNFTKIVWELFVTNGNTLNSLKEICSLYSACPSSTSWVASWSLKPLCILTCLPSPICACGCNMSVWQTPTHSSWPSQASLSLCSLPWPSPSTSRADDELLYIPTDLEHVFITVLIPISPNRFSFPHPPVPHTVPRTKCASGLICFVVVCLHEHRPFWSLTTENMFYSPLCP